MATEHGTAQAVNSSLLRALNVLAVFSANEPRLTLAEISRRMSMPKSTVHRMLHSLMTQGYVERSGSDQYALGTAIIALTQAVRVNVEIRDRVATVARALAEQTRQSVYIAIPDGDRVIYLYAVESTRRLTGRTAVGDRAPYSCTGVGKACLAFMDAAARDAIIADITYEPFTPNTIADDDTLRRVLAETIARGYALDHEEHDRGTFCVAAPFFGADGRLAGGISISGTDPDIAGGRQAEFAAMVIDAARDASGRLGYVVPRPSQRTRSPQT